MRVPVFMESIRLLIILQFKKKIDKETYSEMLSADTILSIFFNFLVV